VVACPGGMGKHALRVDLGTVRRNILGGIHPTMDCGEMGRQISEPQARMNDGGLICRPFHAAIEILQAVGRHRRTRPDSL
jgi:hypothetical protein